MYFRSTINLAYPGCYDYPMVSYDASAEFFFKIFNTDSMGAGRKTQTFIFDDESNPVPPLNGNSSILTRNLRKSDLGGVIFGCKHDTIQECLSKQLFGLLQNIQCILIPKPNVPTLVARFFPPFFFSPFRSCLVAVLIR